MPPAFVRRLQGTKWFLPFYLLVVGLLAPWVFLMLVFFNICLGFVLLVAVSFGLPYWFGERRTRNFLWVALVNLVVVTLFGGLLVASVFYDLPPQTVSGSSGTTFLEGGNVSPARGDLDSNFTYAITFRSETNATPDEVWLNLTSSYAGGGVTDTFPLVASNASDSRTTDGKEYTALVRPPAGVNQFLFSVRVGTDWVHTTAAIGPVSAPFSVYHAFFTVFAFSLMTNQTILFLLVLLIYWWTQRARMLRPEPRGRVEQDVAKGEFLCTNCGATVDAADVKCSKCGAVFEKEAEDEPPKK